MYALPLLSLLKREIFQEQTSLPLLPDLTQALQALSCLPHDGLCLQPRKIPGKVQEKLARFSYVPMHTKYLIRTASFDHAYFGQDFQTLHEAVWRIIGQGRIWRGRFLRGDLPPTA